MKFIQDYQWVELTPRALYELFTAAEEPNPRTARVDPIELEDGTIITADIAIQRLHILNIQDHLDAAAIARGYDSILSACSYAGAPNPYQAESLAFLEWRAACWTTGHQILADVESSVRVAPSATELLAELPILQLP